HPVAPIPASALLSAVMVKVGLLGWIRFLPLGDESVIVLAQPMLILGFTGAFFAAIYGALQDNPKAVLAYSTVSQLGIIVASIGFALAFPGDWEMLLPAIVFFAMHHGFAKATLFFCVGIDSELKPGSRFAPYLWLLILIPALSLIGIPLSSGALAKVSLKSATTNLPLFSILLVLSAIGTTLLMCRFIELMRQQAAGSASNATLRWGLILPTSLSAMMCIGYLYTTPSFEFKSFEAITSTLNWSALWPVILGVSLMLASSKLRSRIPVPAAGDLLIAYREVARLLHKFIQYTMGLFIKIVRDINILIDRSKATSLPISIRPGKELAIEAPGAVVIGILGVLLYAFLI
ncbi:MAG: hypothetical protein HC808_20065, partial [Candidatus Competibacteraceae bacterium]|nr:hypothetical protein [Candidatus Competibacteraceae bacterium]